MGTSALFYFVAFDAQRFVQRDGLEVFDGHFTGEGDDMMQLVDLAHGVVEDAGDDTAVAVPGWSGVTVAQAEFAYEGLALFIKDELEAHAVGIVHAADEAIVFLHFHVAGVVALGLRFGHGRILQGWRLRGDLARLENRRASQKRREVALRHLPRYLNEFGFRFNNRKSAGLLGMNLRRIALSGNMPYFYKVEVCPMFLRDALVRWLGNAKAFVRSALAAPTSPRVGEPVTSPYSNVIFMLIATLASFLFPLFNIEPSLFIGLAIALFIFVLIAHYLWIWDKTCNLRPILKFLIIFAIGIPYGTMSERHMRSEYKKSHRAQADRDKQFQAIQGMTLLDIFRDDFKHFGGASQSYANNQGKVIVGRVFRDIPSRCKFVGFYIPRTEHPYVVVKGLIPKYAALLAEDEGLQETIENAGGTMSSTGLVFTRRVFLYHEQSLEPSEQAAIKKDYSDWNLEVLFRGPAYRQVIILQKMTEFQAGSKAD